MGKVEKDERGDDSYADSCNTLDDEEPSPALDTMCTIQMTRNGSCKNSTKGTGYDCSAVEDSKAFAWETLVLELLHLSNKHTNFFCLVPAAHHEKHAGEEARFDAAKDESKCKE